MCWRSGDTKTPNIRNMQHTHVISELPDRFWSLANIFSAAAFLATFFEFPTASKHNTETKSRMSKD